LISIWLWNFDGFLWNFDGQKPSKFHGKFQEISWSQKKIIDRQQKFFKHIFEFFGTRTVDSSEPFWSGVPESGSLELELIF